MRSADRFVCEDCGISYSLEAVQRMLRQGTADTTDPKLQNADAGVLPAMSNAHAAEPVNEDFEIEDGVLVKYKGEGGDVVIPDGVKEIGDRAFEDSAVTSVVIPEGVEYIGISAFGGCRSLASVTIPEGVEEIGGNAFANCSSLTDVIIPDSVRAIGVYAFFGCSSLTSVTIPGSVGTIGMCAFGYDTALTSVTISNGVSLIDEGAFSHCTGLTSITLPESIGYIHDFAFDSCAGLTEVTIPDSVKYLGLSAFCGCPDLRMIHIRGSVAEMQQETDDRIQFVGRTNLSLYQNSLLRGTVLKSLGYCEYCRGKLETTDELWISSLKCTRCGKANKSTKLP